MSRHFLHWVRSIANPYHESNPENVEKIFELEHTAEVCYKLCPGQIGQVEYSGHFWSARCFDDLILLPGARVKVVDRVDLILVVEPIAVSQSRALRPEKPFEQTDRTA